ncbi:MFS transporter [Dactylosporangium sp. CA-092794]|uniref:MFS transporter n=1 Tax=Dactylosporangium sp. CA-092794 TaxID=3239929 RepID=UPI003D94D46D
MVIVLASVRHFGGPAQGSLALAVLLVPHVVAGPFVGVLTDRARHPRLVHTCFVAGFGLALGGLLLLLGRVPQPVVLGLALIAGCCGPMVFGGLSSRLDDVVAVGSRRRYRGLDAATYNVADIAGPAAGAALVVSAGVPVAAVVLTAVCLGAAALLLSVRPAAAGMSAGGGVAAGVGGSGGDAAGVRTGSGNAPGVSDGSGVAAGVSAGSGDAAGVSAGGGAAEGAPRRRMWHDLRDGLRVIVVSRPLRSVTVASCVSMLGHGMMPSVAVLLGAGHGHPGGGGVLLTAVGAGALTGSLAVARRPVNLPAHLLVLVCLVATGAVFCVVPFVGSWPVLVGLFAVTGLFDGPLLASVLQVRSAEAPPNARTQVFTLGAGVKLTAASVGAAVVASVAAWPVGVLVAAVGGLQLLAAGAGGVLLLGRARGRAAAARALAWED